MKQALSTGQGIAIAGIWIGVGISAFGAGPFTFGIAVFAYFSTGMVMKVKIE